jgi:hypothetical protein
MAGRPEPVNAYKDRLPDYPKNFFLKAKVITIIKTLPIPIAVFNIERLTPDGFRYLGTYYRVSYTRYPRREIASDL